MNYAKYLALACSLAASATASANIDASCYDDTKGLWNGGQPKTTINVYISSNTSEALYQAFGLTQADTELSIRRGLNILNEEYGTSVRLKFSGCTTSTGYITGGIVLKYNLCSNIINAPAEAQTLFNPSSGPPTGVIIRFFKQVGTSCTPIQWSTLEDVAGTTDIVPVMLHELGHGVFNMNHVGDTPPAPNCTDFGQLTVMRPAGGPARSRVPKDWDIEVFQQRYTHRGQWSAFWKRYRTDAVNWSTATSPANQSPAHVLYRMGSLPQGTHTRLLGWVQHPGGAISMSGGAGTYTTAHYESWSNQQSIFGNLSMLRPVAVASRPGTQEMLVAYQQREASAYVTGSDIGLVCYLRSTDGGATYTGPTCPAINTDHDAYRNGLTATYDPYSQVFLVGYVGDLQTIKVWTIPAIGSSAPSVVTVYDAGHGQTAANSWHAPSVACSGAATNSCIVMYEDATNAGLVKWFRAQVDVFGHLNSTTTPATTGYNAYDTPSIVYFGYSSQFVHAFTSLNDAVYAFTMPVSGSTWSEITDMWNDPTSFISTAVLGVRTAPGVNLTGAYTQGWWVRYW